MGDHAGESQEQATPRPKSHREFSAGDSSEQRRFESKEEGVAFKALQRYFPSAPKIEIYDDIPEYGDGTLFLAIASPGTDADGKIQGPYEYQVLVRNGKGVVYTDFSQTLRQGAREPHWLSRYVAPDAVLAAISFVVVGAGVAAWYRFGARPENTTVITAISGAMTTVLGYWFGRMSAPSKDPEAGARKET